MPSTPARCRALLNDAIAQGERGSFQAPDIHPDDIALLQYTGGTAGISKGAVLLHRNVISGTLQAGEHRPSPVMRTIPTEQQLTSTANCALPLPARSFAFTANMMLIHAARA